MVTDFTINQGSTFRRMLTIKDNSGVAIDLDQYEFRGQIRRKRLSPEIIISFTFETQSPSSDGKVEMLLSYTETSSISAGETVDSAASKYVYDVEMVTGSGDVIRILEGAISIDPEVTRDTA